MAGVSEMNRKPVSESRIVDAKSGPAKTIKVWFIQNVLAPYRVSLFHHIADAPGIDFKLILLSKGMKNLDHWQHDYGSLPFKCEHVTGVSFHTNYDNQISLSPRLSVRLWREKPDVVVVAGFSLATIQTLLNKILIGTRYLIAAEATSYTEQGRSSALRRWLRRKLAVHADGLVHAGADSKQYLEKLVGPNHKADYYCSHNAVENTDFAQRVDEFRENAAAFEAFRGRFPQRNVIFVGQFIERKGIHHLIDAYERITKSGDEPIGLIMIGKGPLESFLHEQKRRRQLHRLHVEGFVPREELYKYFAIADAIAIPSLLDPNPLIVLEALAAGVPSLVSYRCGNARDFITDGTNGFIVDPEDTDDFAGKMTSILSANADQALAMRAAARRSVEFATYEASAGAYVDACRHAMGSDKCAG